MIHCKMIHKKTLKTGILCYIRVMTVQERMAFVNFWHQFSKRLMMMKLDDSNSRKIHKSTTFQLPLNEYINELCSQLDKVWFHHFVSKEQAALIYLIYKMVWRMNALFCWILLRTIAILFSMLCMLSFCWLL